MTEAVRTAMRTFGGTETMEGAGVRLRRMFGNNEVPLLDPFLLLDNFGSSNPADYLAGFPWHPHRGIETVTYMLRGKVEHQDSLGNGGVIDSGDIQWMSAGSGILHQEMPRRVDGMTSGFQLWVNLPRKLKMETPAYRGVRSTAIPEVKESDGREVKVVAGTYQGVEGPVRDIPVDPTYLDVSLPPAARFHLPTPKGHTVFAHTLEGSGRFGAEPSRRLERSTPSPGAGPTEPRDFTETPRGVTIVYGDGDSVEIHSGDRGLRFLLVTGKPLREPVAWYGPIVMNTRDQILEAASDLERGTFIRTRKVIDEV